MKSRAQRYRYVRHVVSGTRPSPWSPLSLGTSLAAWYKADAGCYTDAACLFASASNMDLRRASSSSLQVGDIDFSFVLFVKHSTLSSWNSLLRKGFGWEAGGEFSIFSDGSGAVTWRIRKADDSVHVDVTSTDVCGTSAFDMIEVYHDATNNVIGVRVNNGTAVTAAVPAGVFTGTNNLSIGDSDSGGTSDRSIARVGFWKRLTTSAERTWLYNAGAGRFYADLGVAGTDGSDLKTSLVEYWNLCESSGSRVGSHAGLNLTPTNGPTVAAGPGEGLCVDNSPCKRREDQSGNGFHELQTDVTKQRIWIASGQNGKPVLRGNGTSQFGQATHAARLSMAEHVYAFMAAKTPAGTWFSFFAKGASGVAFNYGMASRGGNLSATYNNIDRQGPAISNSTFYVLDVDQAAASSVFGVNGAESTVAGAPDILSKNTEALYFGVVGADYFGGDDAELILVGAVAGTTVTAATKASARAYLNSKYAAY